MYAISAPARRKIEEGAGTPMRDRSSNTIALVVFPDASGTAIQLKIELEVMGQGKLFYTYTGHTPIPLPIEGVMSCSRRQRNMKAAEPECTPHVV